MTICFYSPYIPKHFGGGEKHLLDIASVLAQHAEVSIAVSQAEQPSDCSLQRVKEQYEQFLGRSLDGVSFIESPLGTKESAIRKLLWTGQFDQLFYVTDGSIFFSLARKNHLHFQVPFKSRPPGVLNTLKLRCWRYSNANSKFTQAVIEQGWPGVHPVVVNPRVTLAEFDAEVVKQPWIVNVGRFFRQLHSKRQDVLIEMFKKLSKTVPGWKLILIGSVEDEQYADELKRQAKGLNVEFMFNAKRSEVVDILEKSKIYWHAAGYDVDETEHPEWVEHFGITTVEAMAAGAVPIVQYKGGQKEILGDTLKELGWIEQTECINTTKRLIAHPNDLAALSDSVRKQAEQFGDHLFTLRVASLFQVG